MSTGFFARTPEQSAAWQRLRNGHAHEHLKELHEKYRTLLETAEGDGYRRLQGAATLLRNIIAIIEASSPAK